MLVLYHVLLILFDKPFQVQQWGMAVVVIAFIYCLDNSC